MMAQSRTESTRDTYNYGQYINEFPPNTIKVIREFERIQKNICRHKMSIMFNEICTHIYIYIYIYSYPFIQAVCDTRSICKKCFIGLNAEFLFHTKAKLQSLHHNLRIPKGKIIGIIFFPRVL